ncbi:MAG: winged helix-turn-helix transcriptional regulator [Nitrososphaerota archaeon]|nr:winged helix-turn-helix transcriptional regulator [Nitrososphaerota archaeon]MDG6966485.1 winged helix-turn-helix transcriptional regulator [Nitrososphaerota archaeon]MDG6978656.1 winged helix-turn-helix transcriptional regulator [Nitrososphaerota archaeon]MDG7006416.1 winged helix-turn-helix transcriptional regulator [Nitrososphaerota archaeon]MDG7020399.1 winged helix-turn-helix transcriptional regulator [Nitrososphaerota archaeon]
MGPAAARWPEDDVPFASPGGRAPLKDIDPTQRRILEFIAARPGVHLREICRSLGLAMGDVQYHLRRLERDRRITSTRRGLYKFFYPADLFGEKQREVLSVLGLDTQRELLLDIIRSPGTTQEALVASAGLSQATVSWHLKRLVDLGIVERGQQGRLSTYSVPRGDEIARFIKTYHPTVWERWSSRLADIFIAYSEADEK